MATKIERNWLNRLKQYLNFASDQTDGSTKRNAPVQLKDSEIRTALKKQTSKQIMDARMRDMVYRNTFLR